MSFVRSRIDAVVDMWIDNIARGAMDRSGIDIRAELSASAGRVIKRELRSSPLELPADGLGRYVSDRFYNDTIHIRDWLIGAVGRGDAWLQRRNEAGVPLKLAKFGRMEQIVNEADKAMRKLNGGGATDTVASKVVHDFGNGYTLVELLTDAELTAESRAMQHCVGQGAYHAAVRRGETRILSLRDRFGKPHATIEIEVGINAIVQVKGKQNAIPKVGYFAAIAEWIENSGYVFASSDCPSGYAGDRRGRIIKLASLKAGETFYGNIHISLNDDDDMPELPEGLVINGELHILDETGTFRHVELPKSLTVKSLVLDHLRINQSHPFPSGTLHFHNCLVERLPSAMRHETNFGASTVGGSAWENVIFDGPVTFDVPTFAEHNPLASMIFNGDVRFSGTAGVSIPDGMSFGRDLTLINCKVDFLGSVAVVGRLVVDSGKVLTPPNRLSVGKSFHAHRTSLPSLPEDMTIRQELTISRVTGMTVLPGKAVIGGSICLDNTEIASLEGRTHVNGDLTVKRTPLKELADGTTVRALEIADTKITRLPDSLFVRDDLTIGAGAIRSIPDTLEIGGSLIIGKSSIYTLPDGFCVPLHLDISSSFDFKLPQGLDIGGSLIANKSGILEIPSDIKVHSIDGTGSSLRRLPEGLDVPGDLSIAFSLVTELPPLSVGGSLNIQNTSIMTVPPHVSIGGTLKADWDVIREAEPAPRSRPLGARM